MIYHITTKEQWSTIKTKSYYTPNSLIREGYIHCSFEDQILKVAETLHRGQVDLLILCINETKLGSIFKSEDLFNLKEKYPHIYGELSLKTIEKVVELKISETGAFIKPNLGPISSLVVEQREWT